MTDQEAKATITRLIEGKVGQGFERMRSMERCRQIYVDLKKQGYHKEMDIFKAYVVMATISHPDWTEQEILENLAEHLGITPETYD